ncbi:hypothetical protein MtrunA17_Chr4g0032131 [Medicago truncatula]|uniref:Transmembrane protein n=1 Tax=Medicago truncatula TaxID=3880 RepID=A0A396I9W8_MEDTR|nr:hypothetical protein MtrunA17_Chr4g0032131 [Medicago truncatula]
MCANCGMVCTVYLLNMFHRRLTFLNHQIKHITNVIVLPFTLYLFPFSCLTFSYFYFNNIFIPIYLFIYGKITL